MKATYSIVNKKIKNIYNEKNEKIHLLLKNFTNYFTLNYDPSLYLLLMKFNKKNNSTTMVFQNTLKFRQENLDIRNSGIYKKIKKAHENGNLNFSDIEKGENIQVKLESSTKKSFTQMITIYAQNRSWNYKERDIKAATDLLWDDLKERKILRKTNDGFQGNIFKGHFNQNIFFLHGAFHIYKDNKGIKKITQTADKAFNKKLEEIIDNESKDILCILESGGKREQIKKNDYLKIASQKLATLEGSMVILGSSLSENDAHIFQAINQSKIENIYLSTSEEERDKDFKKAQNYFTSKK